MSIALGFSNMLLEERKALTECGRTLATLCDMVLGEDAEDRSDDALIRAVGAMMRTQPCGHPVQAISQNKSGTQYCRWCVDMDNRYLDVWQDCAEGICIFYMLGKCKLHKGPCGPENCLFHSMGEGGC